MDSSKIMCSVEGNILTIQCNITWTKAIVRCYNDTGDLCVPREMQLIYYDGNCISNQKQTLYECNACEIIYYVSLSVEKIVLIPIKCLIWYKHINTIVMSRNASDYAIIANTAVICPKVSMIFIKVIRSFKGEKTNKTIVRYVRGTEITVKHKDITNDKSIVLKLFSQTTRGEAQRWISSVQYM